MPTHKPAPKPPAKQPPPTVAKAARQLANLARPTPKPATKKGR